MSYTGENFILDLFEDQQIQESVFIFSKESFWKKLRFSEVWND